MRKALKHDWRVEIWSFNQALSNDLMKEAQNNPKKITVQHIDQYFRKISFYTCRWPYPGKIAIPADRTMVLR